MKEQSGKLEIKYVPTKSIIPAEYNPRKMDDEARSRLVREIEAFGIVDPLIVNKHPGRRGILIGGHQRLEAAKVLGLGTVPVVFVDMDETREKALNIALNNPNMQGVFDYPKLKDLITEIDDGEFDLDLTGFNASELTDIFNFDGVGGGEEDEEGEGFGEGGGPSDAPERIDYLFIEIKTAKDFKRIAALLDIKGIRFMDAGLSTIEEEGRVIPVSQLLEALGGAEGE